MPDIGDIHDMLDREVIPIQHTPQEIFKNISAQIADMGVIINSRSAGIQSHFRRVERLKFSDCSGVSVKKLQIHNYEYSSGKW